MNSKSSENIHAGSLSWAAIGDGKDSHDPAGMGLLAGQKSHRGLGGGFYPTQSFVRGGVRGMLPLEKNKCAKHDILCGATAQAKTLLRKGGELRGVSFFVPPLLYEVLVLVRCCVALLLSQRTDRLWAKNHDVVSWFLGGGRR